jgi:uncharacterized coiled-coil protein SlyX
MQANYDYTIVSGLPVGEYMPNWSSIFIPRVHHEMTRQDLVDIVEKELNLGKVSRIDFAASKNGAWKMAFIHMATFYDTLFTFNVRSHMEKYGFWKVPEKYQRNSYIKIRFVINRNQVPKIEFTIEKLADMLTHQSYIIEQQSVVIKNLEEKINSLMVSISMSPSDNNEECRSHLEQTKVDINDLHKRLERIEHRARVQHYEMRQEEYIKDMEEYVEEWEDYENCREREERELYK